MNHWREKCGEQLLPVGDDCDFCNAIKLKEENAMDVINLTVSVCHDGYHYDGVTVHNGVTIDMIDNCAGGKALQFGNCALANPPTPNVGCISAGITEAQECPSYLQLIAAE